MVSTNLEYLKFAKIWEQRHLIENDFFVTYFFAVFAKKAVFFFIDKTNFSFCT